MRKSNFFAIVLFFLICLFPLRAFAFEDINYDITAKFSYDKKSLEARQILSFKNNTGQALKEIYLRTYPNHKYSAKEKKQLYKYASYFKTNPYPQGFDKGQFRISFLKSATSGEPLKYEFEGKDETVMKVILDKPLNEGESLKLEIEFSSVIPHRIGRYGWHKNTFALNRWYPLLSVLDKDGWHNNPDFLLHMPYISESATYNLSLDVPKDFVIATGCDTVLEKEASLDRKIILCSSSAPLRELSLALSKDYSVYELEADGIRIKSFFFKKDESRGRYAAQFAADSLKYYSQQFGKYPYKQFSIAPVCLGYGGSQNAGIIFLDERAYQIPKFLLRYFDFLVSHETGHQWWYNVVGNDEYRQLWLDEGINSYWITRYLENKYGKDAKIIDIPKWAEYFTPNPSFGAVRTYRHRYLAKKGIDWPVISEAGSFYEPSLIFTVAYGKGSAVVDMLSSYVGEEKFSQIMKLYFERYKFGNATVEDFRKISKEVTQQDLKWFFDEWLYTVKQCDYALIEKNKKLILKKIGKVSMPIEVKLEFKDGSEKIVASEGKNEEEIIELPEGKILKKARADYGSKLLDIDRVNNNFPRLIDKKFVPLYHGLYEIPLFLKEDTYSWITGPSISQYGVGIKSSFQKPIDYIAYAASHYDFNSESFNHSIGFEKNNFLNKYLSLGVEFLDRDALTDKEDDLKSCKVYMRAELDMGYSLFDLNSHLTLYLLRNQALGKSGFLSSREEARSLNYRQNKETILGATYYSSDAGAFPDPSLGHKLNATQEFGGHILDGGDSFSRSIFEFGKYFEIRHGHKLAVRLKGCAGYPKDKYLFYLGSDRELRGYDYKDIKGSSALLGSFEYRFPLVEELDGRFLYDTLNLDQVQGVLFFDTGSAWFDKFNEPGFKKDVGLGLRFYFNVIGAAERFALRLDLAYPLDGEDRDTHLWVGLNHAF